jgi:hypothetical protein
MLISFQQLSVEVSKIFDSSSTNIEDKFDQYYFLIDAVGWDDLTFDMHLLQYIDSNW